MERTRADRVQDESPQFPLRLLIAGYATGAACAVAALALGGGLILAGLTFWLGGGVATLGWGAVMFLARRSARDRATYSARGAVAAGAK